MHQNSKSSTTHAEHRVGRHRLREKVEGLLALADIQIGGNRPWDLHVHNDGVYARVLAQGAMALGESYVDGWWDCAELDEFFHRLFRSGLYRKANTWAAFAGKLYAKLVNLQTPSRAFHIGRHHYDIGNDWYRALLGEKMIYSCGYWADAADLDAAQEAKLDLVCRKLELEPGMRVLDIGCGWGGAAKFAAERYGAEVLGITVSEAQVALARECCRGLPVEIRLQDYRRLEGSFDRVFSLGMFEHVGHKNYVTFMRVVRRCLKDGGLFLLQSIGGNHCALRTDPWLAHYIFPNSMLPSPRQLGAAIEDVFVLEDWHNFGADYDKTLMAWHKNMHQNWDSLEEKYGARFRRTWDYYLLSCAGAFRARHQQLWQVLLSNNGVPGGYRAAR